MHIIFDGHFWQFWQFLQNFGKHLRCAENCPIFREKKSDFLQLFESFQIFWKFLWPETWHLRHWLHFWQLRTTIWTITLWPLNTEWWWQHSQFLRCFVYQEPKQKMAFSRLHNVANLADYQVLILHWHSIQSYSVPSLHKKLTKRTQLIWNLALLYWMYV